MTRLIIVLVAACGICCGGGSRPAATSIETPTESHEMTDLWTDPHGDEDTWRAAEKATLKQFADATSDVPDSKVRVFPTTDRQGNRLPYWIDIEFGENQGRVLIRDGSVVRGGGGVQGAQAYLAWIGFPATRITLDFMFQVLGHFRVLDRRWAPYPLFGFEKLDESFEIRGEPLPELIYEDDGTARLVIRKSFTSGREMGEETVEVKFAADATIEIVGPTVTRQP